MPRIFWGLFPRWGKYGNAAVIHDWLYWEQNTTRKEADEIFREASGILGVAGWRQFLMYWTLRLAGKWAWRGNRTRRKKGGNRVGPIPTKSNTDKAR